MSTSVGTLMIEIATNVARLQTDMNAAKRVVGDAMGDVTRAVNAAKTAFVALGGVTSLVGLERVVSGAIEAKARLYDLSTQTGITVEALSGLQKVGKYSNTSITDIAAASNKLSKALFTQTEDSKGAAQAIRALGLNFEAFRRLQAQEQLVAVANAMGKFQDGTEKSAAAMMLYGKTGAQLLPFLSELEERGYAVGKQTTESALQAKKYEDNLVTLKIAGDAWKRTFAEAVLPTLIDITDALIDARKEVDNVNIAGEALKVTIETLSVSGMYFVDTWRGVGREMAAIAAQWNVMDEAATANRSWLDPFGTKAAWKVAGGPQWTAISDAVKEDGERAKASLDKYVDMVMGVRAKIGSYSDFQRGDKDTTPVPRPRLKLAESAAKEVKAADDGYAALIARIREKVAIDQLELESGRKITEAEKFRLGVQKDVAAHLDKLTPARRQAIALATEEAIAIMKQHDAWQAETKWIEEATGANAAFVESQQALLAQMENQRNQAQDQLEQYGLSREAIDALQAARLRDAASALERNAVLAEDIDLSGALTQLYREQAQALRDNAAARETLIALKERDHDDALTGADAAVMQYLANVKHAGDATYYAVSNAVNGLEDVTVAALSGHGAKDAARAWVNGIIAEITRIAIVKPMMAEVFGGNGGMGSTFGSFANLIGGLFGGGMGSNPSGFGGTLNNPSAFVATPLAAGTDFVPYDGFLASLHKGERVVPQAYNPAAGGAGGGMQVVIENHGADVSQQTERGPGGEERLRIVVREAVAQAHRAVASDLAGGTGIASTALKNRGVNMGNAALRRT